MATQDQALDSALIKRVSGRKEISLYFYIHVLDNGTFKKVINFQLHILDMKTNRPISINIKSVIANEKKWSLSTTK